MGLLRIRGLRHHRLGLTQNTLMLLVGIDHSDEECSCGIEGIAEIEEIDQPVSRCVELASLRLRGRDWNIPLAGVEVV